MKHPVLIPLRRDDKTHGLGIWSLCIVMTRLAIGDTLHSVHSHYLMSPDRPLDSLRHTPNAPL